MQSRPNGSVAWRESLAHLLGYVFAGSDFKGDVERSFYAIGHGLLIPLFFISIGTSSDYRALAGHGD